MGAVSAPARRLDAGYELRLAARDGVIGARVTSKRPAGALRVAEGRPAAEAAGLAGMLFPMNATAQTAAALSAAEAALKVNLGAAQTAARQMLVGFEAAAGCAWRMGLAWAQLTGASARSEVVQEARAASSAIAGAIFEDGEWARVGGGVVRPRPAEILDHLNTLQRVFRQLEPALDDVIDTVPALASLKGRAWPLLDETGVERAALALAEDPGFAARPHLSGRAIEESPRAVLQLWRLDEGLASWFRAQARFAHQLPGRLEKTARNVVRADPAHANLKGSGRGWGLAITERGRLIHWMALDRGKVRAWRAIEPTDWNFSPNGPVARAAELLHPDSDLNDGGRWIVAAFDPSAPCRVVVESADEEAY